jgi:hypothetical protein
MFDRLLLACLVVVPLSMSAAIPLEKLHSGL